MAKVVFTYSEGPEDTGSFTNTVGVNRDGVENIQDLLEFFGQAMRAAGFTYVDAAGARAEDGQVWWSRF